MTERRRILFATSNGTGLGHLTRSMAIASRLDDALEPLFVTFSAAAPVVRGLGFPVEYVASYDRPGAGDDIRWTARVRARLEAIVAEADPAVVVFDGTHPYERLLPALRSTGARLVWCRRAMWRRGSETAPLWRSHLFDAVLEPGEIAAEADRGPTVARREEAHRVGPIVLVDRTELLPRAEAERRLGIEPGRTTALVQLGQGEGVREANRRCLALLASRGEIQVAALASTLAALDDVPEGVIRLRATYPISRFMAAFDVAVAASGYNFFHELIELGVPSLFVPMARRTDDQAARARYAERAGLALACEGPSDPALEAKLASLADPDRRARMRAALAELPPARGAADAAGWLEALAAAAPGAERTREGPASRTAGLRARRAAAFVASVPRTLGRIGYQLATRPRMRTLALAFGGDGESIAAELGEALDRAGERPERTLLVTDSLDFAPLLAAGVGLEHVPGPAERQPELAGVAWEEFAAARIAAILAARPRPRRMIEIGAVPERVRAAAGEARG